MTSLKKPITSTYCVRLRLYVGTQPDRVSLDATVSEEHIHSRLTAYRVRACSSVDCSTRRANLSSAFSAGRSSRHEMCNASSVGLPHNATARTAWLTKEIA